MRSTTRIFVTALTFLGGLAASASVSSAQLVFGTTTTTTTNPAAVYLNVTTGQTTTLWNSIANKKVNGLAADDAGGRLFANDAARLNVWTYGQLGTAPTLIAGLYRNVSPNPAGTGDAATGFSGLAWANGKLYGSTSFASATFKRGIYEIPLVPNNAGHLVATPVWVEPVDTGILTLDGLDYDPTTNLFYGVQDSDNTGTGGTLTRGVYSIDVFGTGAFTKIANFPGANTRVDGLAVGGGKLWLTQQTGASNIVEVFPYDLTSQTYGTTISFALADATNRASGATWATGNVLPEPTTLAALGGVALVMARRRK
jgi:hypothetical protein